MNRISPGMENILSFPHTYKCFLLLAKDPNSAHAGLNLIICIFQDCNPSCQVSRSFGTLFMMASCSSVKKFMN
jgi:hypothetical protein